MPEAPVLNLPLEALVKSHNVLLNLVTENFELKARLEKAMAFIAELEQSEPQVSEPDDPVEPE